MDWWPFVLKMETLESASVNLADTIARHFHPTARTFRKLSSAALLASQHGIERIRMPTHRQGLRRFLRWADEATLPTSVYFSLSSFSPQYVQNPTTVLRDIAASATSTPRRNIAVTQETISKQFGDPLRMC
jgi:hypothetical protein